MRSVTAIQSPLRTVRSYASAAVAERRSREIIIEVPYLSEGVLAFRGRPQGGTSSVRSLARRQVPKKPSLREGPFALHRGWRYPKRFGRLVDGKSGEES